MIYASNTIITIFNQLFAKSEQTLLIGGGQEPLYQPASEADPFNRIIFTQDYYASALHEIAHWCIAGKERRKLTDYGYWYNPDGRTQDQQLLFEQVEVKPQAIEWIFAVAAGIRFYVSLDNLSGNIEHSRKFKEKIYNQTHYYLNHGLPPRAEKFKNSLLKFYKRTDIFTASLFNFADL